MPNVVIQQFHVPIFLLPIYQAAGSQYGIRWEVLAAINEIETDYGRNLNVSTAGAVGWMQFMPSTWKLYGVDANKDGYKDPNNPADAIFAAARYLRAAGAARRSGQPHGQLPRGAALERDASEHDRSGRATAEEREGQRSRARVPRARVDR